METVKLNHVLLIGHLANYKILNLQIFASPQRDLSWVKELHNLSYSNLYLCLLSHQNISGIDGKGIRLFQMIDVLCKSELESLFDKMKLFLLGIGQGVKKVQKNIMAWVIITECMGSINFKL